MLHADLHRLMLDALSPDPGVLVLRQDAAVDSVAKHFHRRRVVVQDHRRRVVWHMPLGLGVDAEQGLYGKARKSPDNIKLMRCRLHVAMSGLTCGTCVEICKKIQFYMDSLFSKT